VSKISSASVRRSPPIETARYRRYCVFTRLDESLNVNNLLRMYPLIDAAKSAIDAERSSGRPILSTKKYRSAISIAALTAPTMQKMRNFQGRKESIEFSIY
jgi:hypothetical protein